MVAFFFIACAIAGLCVVFGLTGLLMVFALQVGAYSIRRWRK